MTLRDSFWADIGAVFRANNLYSIATQGYECVPSDQCDKYGEIITDGGGLLDIRTIEIRAADVEPDPEEFKCPRQLDKCCRHPDFSGAVDPVTAEAPTAPPPVNRFHEVQLPVPL